MLNRYSDREPMDDNDLHNRVERQQLLVSGLKENEARFDHIFVLGELLFPIFISFYLLEMD